MNCKAGITGKGANAVKKRSKLAVTLRGFRLMNRLMPGFLPIAAVRAVLEAFLPFINIYLSGRILTAVAEGSRLQEVTVLLLVLVLSNFTVTLLLNLFSRLANVKGAEFWRLSHLPIDRKLQTMDYEYVEDSEIHARKANISLMESSMGRGLPRLYWMYFNMGMRSLAQVVFSVALTVSAFTAQPVRAEGVWAVLLSPWSSCVLVLLFLLTLIGNARNNAVSAKKEAKIFEGFSKTTRVMQYYYSLFRDYRIGKDLKLYQLKDSLLSEIKRLDSTIVGVMQRWQKMSTGYQVLASVTSTLISGLIYAYVALKAMFGAFSVGGVAQYVGALTQFTQGFERLVVVFSDLFINAEFLQKYFDFLDIPDKMPRGTLPVEKRAFCEGGDMEYEIECRDVSFRYPGTDTWALRHVNLKFRVGERLAVVGKNGSGKTTFIKLLCRLYDPTEGEILLNGIDIRKYDYEEYLSLFSVVFQDFKLFSFELGQNVAASVEVDEERARACLEQAGFGTRLQELPKGLYTSLYKDFEEDGVEISGGEAQKIALARALYKDAPFLVLDEPTAALDPVAEYEVYTGFNRMVGNRTAVYISHRLSSCRFCDEIVVFDEGQIVQRGSHEALVSQEDGLYARLWNAQAQYYTEQPPA